MKVQGRNIDQILSYINIAIEGRAWVKAKKDVWQNIAVAFSHFEEGTLMLDECDCPCKVEVRTGLLHVPKNRLHMTDFINKKRVNIHVCECAMTYQHIQVTQDVQMTTRWSLETHQTS